MERLLKLFLASILFVVWGPYAFAQYPGGYGPQPIGQCVDQMRGQAFAILPNLYAYQVGNPGNQGQAWRDPSGMYFLRMPAANPFVQAFFVTWDMRIVELNMYAPAPMVIGTCQFAQALPAPPPTPNFNFAHSSTQGVIQPGGGIIPVPRTVARQAAGVAPPRIATESEAQNCYDRAGGNKDSFANCMMPKMLSPQQMRAYECARSKNGDQAEMGACLAKQMVGSNEAKAIDQTMQCYKKHGKEYDKYPLCMAGQQFDEKTAATVNCISDQASSGEVTGWTLAGCAAGNQLGMNAEMAIAVQCAMSTGGQPYAFAGCTAGQLTQRELTKCFTKGVGGDGCFGPNNDIVKGLKAFGVDLGNLTNPNGEGVKAWNTAVNDLQNGPGKNNDIIKAADTVNREIQNAGNSVKKEANNLLERAGIPGIRF